MSKVIAVDMDLTLIDTDRVWFEWLQDNAVAFNKEKYYYDLERNQVDYYLPAYFSLYDDLKPMSFWEEDCTFKNATLLPDSLEVLEKLYNEGNTIIFVSYCMGCPNQMKNKVDLLYRNFGKVFGRDLNFVATNKKNMVTCDVLIDDRNSFLGSMSEGVQLIKMNTPYTQDKKLDRKHVLVDNWFQIYKELGEK